MLRRTAVLGLSAALVLASAPGCSFFEAVGFAPNRPDPEAVKLPAGREEPPRVVVRHVLISCDEGNIPGVTRTRAEAERLAAKVQQLATTGHDFGELVRLYSDDRHGDGRYRLANWGVPAKPGEADRESMVRGFGRVAFSLDPGQIGVLPFDKNDSPYGWHIMRREE